MASTQARQTARSRARAAQQKVLADRKRRDSANMASLTEYFAGLGQVQQARLSMAEALDAIRQREGTLSAAAALAGITVGEARKLVALLTDPPSTAHGNTDAGDSDTGAEPGDASSINDAATDDDRDGTLA